VRVFLDTNIVLDVLLNRPGLADESEAVILRCEAAGDPMFMAWHGVATAYYLIRRGRTEAQAMAELDKLLAWVRVA
jgi:predicted nucleic acid-binding protein